MNQCVVVIRDQSVSRREAFPWLRGKTAAELRKEERAIVDAIADRSGARRQDIWAFVHGFMKP